MLLIYSPLTASESPPSPLLSSFVFFFLFTVSERPTSLGSSLFTYHTVSFTKGSRAVETRAEAFLMTHRPPPPPQLPTVRARIQIVHVIKCIKGMYVCVLNVPTP